MHWIAKPIIKYLAVLVSGMIVGFTVNGWRLSTEIAQQAARHSQELTAIAQLAAQKSQEALDLQAQAQVEVATLDRKFTDELSAAQSETNRLRDAVAAGERQLRINARCPAPANSMPSTTAAPGVADDSSARLDDAAERHYWTLRDRISVATNQITALQAYITDVCLK